MGIGSNNMKDDFKSLIHRISVPAWYKKECRKVTHKIFQVLLESNRNRYDFDYELGKNNRKRYDFDYELGKNNRKRYDFDYELGKNNRKRYDFDYDIVIGKTTVGGSLAKGTAILYNRKNGSGYQYPDLDLVVYVNNEKPPFEEIYHIYKGLLEELPEVRDCEKNDNRGIEVREYSIKFYVNIVVGTLKVDLLVATNHVINSSDCYNVAEEEANIALEIVARKQWLHINQYGTVSKHENHLRSASFTLLTVQLIKSYLSDSMILKIVKLAKFWSSQIKTPKGKGMYSPRGCMLEVVAISTQISNQYGKRRNNSVVSGFKRFLMAMARLSKLDISLDKDPWKVPTWRYSTPMVVDPTNHFNDLANGLQPEVVQVYMDQARRTLKWISWLENDRIYKHVITPIHSIFHHKNFTLDEIDTYFRTSIVPQCDQNIVRVVRNISMCSCNNRTCCCCKQTCENSNNTIKLLIQTLREDLQVIIS